MAVLRVYRPRLDTPLPFPLSLSLLRRWTNSRIVCARRSSPCPASPSSSPDGDEHERERERAVERCVEEHDEDVLLLFHHRPVYTAGRSFRPEHSRPGLSLSPVSECPNPDEFTSSSSSSSSVPLYRVDRGGSVTFHGPGQLCAYPVFNLTRAPHQRDLHRFLRTLEAAVRSACVRFGLSEAELHHDPEHTGVWYGRAKVCSIGLSCSRWVTSHGLSLNLNVDLRAFEAIVPCGIDRADRGVTNVSDHTDEVVDVEQAAPVLVEEISRAFGFERFEYVKTHLGLEV